MAQFRKLDDLFVTGEALASGLGGDRIQGHDVGDLAAGDCGELDDLAGARGAVFLEGVVAFAAESDAFRYVRWQGLQGDDPASVGGRIASGQPGFERGNHLIHRDQLHAGGIPKMAIPAASKAGQGLDDCDRSGIGGTKPWPGAPSVDARSRSAHGLGHVQG